MEQKFEQPICCLCAADLTDKEIDASRAMTGAGPDQLYCDGCRRRFHGCAAVRHNPGA